MEENEVLINLKNSLNEEGRVAFFNPSKSELVIRCVYCGDSQKNSKHAHFFIKNSAPFPFYCQRCNTAGILDSNTLRDISVNDGELIANIAKVSRKALKNLSINEKEFDTITSKKKIKIPDITLNNKTKMIMDYISNRIGKEVTLDMLKEMRVVTSYKKFIIKNKVRSLIQAYDSGKIRKKVDFIEDNSVGFLSLDNNYINFRHMKPNEKGFRFSIESTNFPLNLGRNIYTISKPLDMMCNTLNLVIAEGMFDIISIYYNLYGATKDPNYLFIASTGKGFNSVFKLLKYSGFLNINLELYSDKDVSLDFYRKFLKSNEFEKITIHYNDFEGEKDFGVPLDRIKKKSYILKR